MSPHCYHGDFDYEIGAMMYRMRIRILLTIATLCVFQTSEGRDVGKTAKTGGRECSVKEESSYIQIGRAEMSEPDSLKATAGCHLLRYEEGLLRRELREHPELRDVSRLKKASGWGFQVGDVKSWWATDFTLRREYQVPSTCRAVGNHAYIFVEDALWSSGRANQTAVESIREAIDDRVPSSPTKGIFQLDTENFGELPDVDGDPRIVILILDIKDGFVPGATSYVAGYFFSINELPDETSGRRSNQAEIYYVDGYPGNLVSSVGLLSAMSTAAHELQHMIHWNHDLDELDFVDESCSETASLICGYPFENQELYTNETDVSLMSWSGGLSDYSRAARWGLYLWNQFPNGFFRTLVADRRTGIDGVNNTIRSYSPERNFTTVFQDWLIANYINDASINPRFAYNYGSSLTRPRSVQYRDNPNTGFQSASVSSLAADYIEFSGNRAFSITISSSSNAVAVKGMEIGPSDKKVVDVNLNMPFSETQFGTRYTSIAFVIINTSTNLGSQYSYEATESQGNTVSIGGLVQYASGFSTPISGVEMVLGPQYVVSGTNGSYQFTNVSSGTYGLGASKGNGGWGGVNATDALLIARHFVGLQRITDTLLVRAADVNVDGLVNATDALLALRRSIGLDQTFPAGDWLFTRPSVTVGTSSVTQDIYGVCVGDMNGSNVPANGTYFPKLSEEGNIRLEVGGMDRVGVRSEFEVVIRAGEELEIAAMQMKIGYPGDLGTYVGMKSSLEGVVVKGGDGEVNLGWCSMTGLARRVKAAEELVRLRYKSTEKVGIFRAEVQGGVMAKEDGTSYGSVRLVMREVEVGGGPTEFSLGQNYPNPFNPSTTIRYEMPKAGNVSLKIYNTLGQVVATLVEEDKEAGYYQVEWNANVPTGIYFYRLQAGQFAETKKMTLVK